MFEGGGNKVLKSRYHPAECIKYLSFALVSMENQITSEIGFTVRFSFRTELGSIAHHVLNIRAVIITIFPLAALVMMNTVVFETSRNQLPIDVECALQMR